MRKRSGGNRQRTVGVAGELLGVAVDVADAVGLDGDVGLHQSVFLQQILHTQQVLPVVLGQQQHLPGSKVNTGRSTEERSFRMIRNKNVFLLNRLKLYLKSENILEMFLFWSPAS